MPVLLEKAIRIALEAHSAQKDRAGAPYVLHPLRLLSRMPTPDLQIVAVLHDVVEDSDWTIEALRREGFPERILEAVDALTKREGEDYEALIERARQCELARPVKIADLEDNMDARRFAILTAADAERFNKYLRAWRSLVQAGTENRS